MIMRFLFGLPGRAGRRRHNRRRRSADGSVAALCPAAGLAAAFDVDGNGQADARTDGIVLIRYLSACAAHR